MSPVSVIYNRVSGFTRLWWPVNLRGASPQTFRRAGPKLWFEARLNHEWNGWGMPLNPLGSVLENFSRGRGTETSIEPRVIAIANCCLSPLVFILRTESHWKCYGLWLNFSEVHVTVYISRAPKLSAAKPLLVHHLFSDSSKINESSCIGVMWEEWPSKQSLSSYRNCSKMCGVSYLDGARTHSWTPLAV